MINVAGTTAFDRFFIRTSKYFKIGDSVDAGTKNIRDDSVKKWYFHRYWKQNQLSDHNLVWFELNIDSSVDFLQSKARKLATE